MARSKLNFDNPLLNGAASEPTEEKKKLGRPRRDDLVRDNSTQDGLPAEYTRWSVICKVETVRDLKDYAYTKRITLKEAVDEVVGSFFREYRANPENEPLLDHTRGRGKE